MAFSFACDKSPEMGHRIVNTRHACVAVHNIHMSTVYIQTLSVLDTTFQCYCRPANMWCLWSVWLHTCMIHTGRQLPTYSHHLEWGSRWWTQLWQAWVAARMPKEQQVSMSCVWHHMSSALAFRLRRAEPANKFCAFMHGCMQLMVKAVC